MRRRPKPSLQSYAHSHDGGVSYHFQSPACRGPRQRGYQKGRGQSPAGERGKRFAYRPWIKQNWRSALASCPPPESTPSEAGCACFSNAGSPGDGQRRMRKRHSQGTFTEDHGDAQTTDDRKAGGDGLLGMVEALKTQEQDSAARELSFLERFGLLVDQQWNWRENQAVGRRLKKAKLRVNACVEDIHYRTARGCALQSRPHNCQSRAGTNRSVIPHLRMAFLTGWFTTLTVSKCVETRGGRTEERRIHRGRRAEMMPIPHFVSSSTVRFSAVCRRLETLYQSASRDSHGSGARHNGGRYNRRRDSSHGPP
jgi:IstB-like ATP binding protein